MSNIPDMKEVQELYFAEKQKVRDLEEEKTELIEIFCGMINELRSINHTGNVRVVDYYDGKLQGYIAEQSEK